MIILCLLVTVSVVAGQANFYIGTGIADVTGLLSGGALVCPIFCC